MAFTEKTVTAGKGYTVHLTFDGVARYTIVEYVPADAGWTKSKVLQGNGNSEDAQHDTYDLTPLKTGERVLVAIKANMTSVLGDADVSMSVEFEQGGKSVHTDSDKGKDEGDEVKLKINTVFVGS